ncbi:MULTISPECIES: hypothetical protein [Streptomyces]|uniref:hypothetical protein n=1 Tax=Streptomyces TaxID=1883 RepID=UPI0023DD1E20|nr:hypothetical protein [Streptomyces sp. FXJ1.172]WEP00842.1 hypothetical protein A6P39_042495 [Streptomyces sp. FXJ1.172]
MRIRQKLSRRFTATVGTALAAGAAVIAASAPASAAISNHRVQLCAQGNYVADITWSTGLHSFIVTPGSCQTFDIVGTGPYTIGGFYNVSKAHFDIVTVLPGPGGFNADTPGSKWGAEGTTTNPYYVRWQ